jgi:hypothetical protein
VWKRPTKWCEGPDDGHMKSATARNRFGLLRRGKLFGWHVCVDCGKPSKGHVEYEMTRCMRILCLGFNLLRPKYSGEIVRYYIPTKFIELDEPES